MFQLAQLTIQIYVRPLCGSCGADKTCFYVSSQKWAIGF